MRQGPWWIALKMRVAAQIIAAIASAIAAIHQLLKKQLEGKGVLFTAAPCCFIFIMARQRRFVNGTIA